LIMKSAFRQLSPREKQVLRTLSLALVLALVFLVFISLGERRTYFRTRDTSDARVRESVARKKVWEQKKLEWERWQQAILDLAELKTNYFYDDAQGINELRLDLQRIFDEAGVSVNGINYSYSQFPKEAIKKVSAAFHLTGSYLNIKQFIDRVEKFPKFLTMERVDFQKIDTENDSLDLNIVLAGYYEM
jgi:Tfp pilus assembly protein PilO